jgi:DNA-binding MarR family transcriptional regulator
MMIQIRDRRLLEFLSRLEVLSTAQICTFIFPAVAKTTVARRLRKLEKENWIYRQRFSIAASALWSLTEKGAKQIPSGVPYQRCNRETVFKSFLFARIRLELESLGLGENWSSHRDLRARKKESTTRDQRRWILPDALFVRQKDGEPRLVAMQVLKRGLCFEKSQKILKHYAQMDTLYYLWLLTEHDQERDVLFSQWRIVGEIANAPVLICTDVQDFFANPRQAKIYLRSGKIYSLQDYFDLKPETPSLSEDQNRLKEAS